MITGTEMRMMKAETEVYVTPTEEFGITTSIPTEDLTPEEFSALRKAQNCVAFKGDIEAYFKDKPNAIVPKTVSAAIGASAIPQILGTCTYADSTAMNLFNQMLGYEEKVITPFMQKAFDAGHFFEFLIAQEFCRRNYLTLLKPTGMIYFTENPRFYCNVDFFARNEETGEIFILEIKNPNGNEHQKEVHFRWDNNMEAEQQYIDQVLYQMFLTGVHKGYVVYGWCGSPYAINNNEIDNVYGFEVQYDKERIDLEERAVNIFIDALINVDKEALLKLPSAQAKDFVMVYGEGEGELETDSDKWKIACDRYHAAETHKKMADKELAEAESEIVKLLEGYNSAIVHNDRNDYEITRKVRESKSWSPELEALLCEANRDVWEKYTSFSITEAQLKKLDEETRNIILSCRQTKVTPTAGVKVTHKPNKPE